MAMAQDPAGSAAPQESVFGRAETALAHAVYGLILTMATLGELLEHHVSAGTAVAWLLGSGVVLLAAHLFSDVLAHVAASRDDSLNWSEILQVGHEDVSVVAGSIGAALVMTVAAVADLDTERALAACAVAGLVSLGVLSAYATAHLRRSVQVVMSGGAVVLGAVIVFLENTI